MLACRAGLWTCGSSHGHALAFVLPLDFNAVLGLVLGGRREDGFAKLLEEVEKYHAETLRLVVEVTNRDRRALAEHGSGTNGPNRRNCPPSHGSTNRPPLLEPQCTDTADDHGPHGRISMVTLRYH